MRSVKEVDGYSSDIERIFIIKDGTDYVYSVLLYNDSNNSKYVIKLMSHDAQEFYEFYSITNSIPEQDAILICCKDYEDMLEEDRIQYQAMLQEFGS